MTLAQAIDNLLDGVCPLGRAAMTPDFRPDGWPLCPRCGDDELYCLAQAFDLTHDHKAPPCPEMRCYRCNWHGVDLRLVPDPEHVAEIMEDQ